MSVSRIILTFVIFALVFVGAVFVISQAATTPPPTDTYGNYSSGYLINNSYTNQTVQLMQPTMGAGMGMGIVLLLIIGCLIIISAVTLISRRGKR